MASNPPDQLNHSAGSSSSGPAAASDGVFEQSLDDESSSSSDSDPASDDGCDEADQQGAAAPHFLENLLSLGWFRCGQEQVLTTAARLEAGHGTSPAWQAERPRRRLCLFMRSGYSIFVVPGTRYHLRHPFTCTASDSLAASASVLQHLTEPAGAVPHICKYGVCESLEHAQASNQCFLKTLECCGHWTKGPP